MDLTFFVAAGDEAAASVLGAGSGVPGAGVVAGEEVLELLNVVADRARLAPGEPVGDAVAGLGEAAVVPVVSEVTGALSSLSGQEADGCVAEWAEEEMAGPAAVAEARRVLDVLRELAGMAQGSAQGLYCLWSA